MRMRSIKSVRMSTPSHSIGDDSLRITRVSTTRRRIKLLIMTIAAIVAVIAVFLEAPEHPAYALGQGEVCVFFAPSGADNLGHVGWAFRDKPNHWTFGSTENRSGKGSVDAGGNIYAWMLDGNGEFTRRCLLLLSRYSWDALRFLRNLADLNCGMLRV